MPQHPVSNAINLWLCDIQSAGSISATPPSLPRAHGAASQDLIYGAGAVGTEERESVRSEFSLGCFVTVCSIFLDSFIYFFKC